MTTFVSLPAWRPFGFAQDMTCLARKYSDPILIVAVPK